ncbi:MAG: hypothetical protein H0V44_06000 [Planctomycetes bacterium]|nr:hypothetical protein [Planctomycetota bacterium]
MGLLDRRPSLRGCAIALAAIAGIACAANAHAAVTVSDDSLALTLGAQLQTRVQRATALDALGQDHDAVLGRPGRSDGADFSLRRFRLSLTGSYHAVYKFALVSATDGVDSAGYQTSRQTQAYKAWIARDFYTGDLTHTLHTGLDHAFFNRSVASEASHLFPQQRATAALMPVRGVGARYKLTGDHVDLGVDVMNGLDTGKPTANADRSDGLFYSARLELALLEGTKPEYRESYAGASGEGLILAVDVGYDHANHVTPLQKTSSLGYGVEALAHQDGLSALIDLRWLSIRGASTVGAGDVSSRQHVYLMQIGYAVPLDAGVAIEPAIRYSILEFDTPGDEVYDTTANPDSEWGGSGRQVDAGLNVYFNKHANKLQLSYARWDAESGDARAHIIRLQHQFYF